MKKYKFLTIAIVATFIVQSCKQEVIETKPIVDTTAAVIPNKGSLDFSKFVAVGTSYTAGFQAGALFTAGQDNSLAAILNKQFESVGSPAAFNQPTIHSEFGFNIFVTPNPIPATNPPVVLGRFLLQYGGAASPQPRPQLSDVGAIPNPGVNPGFIYGDGTTKAALNNFSIQAIVLGQALIPQTGDWAGAGADPRFNPFYGRLAYPSSGGSTLIGDVAQAGGSFFFLWLGMDDFMLYAAYGGDATKAPLTNPTGMTPADFDYQYGGAVSTLLGSNPALKGVVANFPDIFVMPHFTSVPWNPIPMDAATAEQVNGELSVNYNAFLAGMVQNQLITQAEADARNINFAAGQNGALMTDESLTDLSPYMAGPYAGLIPYAQARQTKVTDVLPLAAGSVLGTLVNNDPTMINGVTIPLADRYVLIPDEINAINNARVAYNLIVANTVTAFSDKLALADMESAMHNLVVSQVTVQNGVTITPNINPPTGIYSEDGIHPNSRGYAFLSNVVISAINGKTAWGATIPKTNVSLYGATALPIP